jgi:hypothetical protein
LVKGIARAAQKRSIPFTLTAGQVDEIATRECFYCGRPPSQVIGKGWSAYTYSGLDRVDNRKGYEKSNVVPCCGQCNQAKSDRDAAAFIAWAGRVAAHCLARLVAEQGKGARHA